LWFQWSRDAVRRARGEAGAPSEPEAEPIASGT